MNWVYLKLWAEVEEKNIHKYITESLIRLINSKTVISTDEEIIVSGKLRPFLYEVKKEMRLLWTFQPEASSFGGPINPKPIGHPDFRLSLNTPGFDQYDYDIECKLVRIKRKGKSWNYCDHYVIDGIKRYQDCKYAQTSPPMGTMIGYVQEGDIEELFETIKNKAVSKCSSEMQIKGNILESGVTKMVQQLIRSRDNCTLFHMWADVRKV